jgi:hypothetical protein
MVEFRLPHEVYYETGERISILDVTEALLGTEELLTELGPLLEACVPGLTVERIEVSINEISEGSLRELMWAAIFVPIRETWRRKCQIFLNTYSASKWGISIRRLRLYSFFC